MTTPSADVQYVSHILNAQEGPDRILTVQTFRGEVPLARVMAEIKAQRGLVEPMGIAIDPQFGRLTAAVFCMVPVTSDAANYFVKLEEPSGQTKDR